MQLDFLNNSSLAKADPVESKALQAEPIAIALRMKINFIFILKALGALMALQLFPVKKGSVVSQFRNRPHCHLAVRAATHQLGVMR